MPKILLDGNDGTGKSTTMQILQKMFPNLEFKDRCFLTQMTDISKDNWGLFYEQNHNQENLLYIIFYNSVEQSRTNLLKAGKDLNEQYHTIADLTHYNSIYEQIYETFKYKNNFLYINIFSNPNYLEIIKQSIENKLCLN